MALPMFRPCLRRGRCTSLEAHLALLVQRISACYDNKAARLFAEEDNEIVVVTVYVYFF